jgi:hypothetical protein
LTGDKIVQPVHKKFPAAVDRVPAEVWQQVLQPLELGPVDLCRLGATNRSLYSACRQDSLWRLFSPAAARGQHASLKDAFVQRAYRRCPEGNDYVLATGRPVEDDSGPNWTLVLKDTDGRDPDADAATAFFHFSISNACSAVREDRRIVERVVRNRPNQVRFAPTAMVIDIPLLVAWTKDQPDLCRYLPAAAAKRAEYWRLVCAGDRYLARYVPNEVEMEPEFWHEVARGLRVDDPDVSQQDLICTCRRLPRSAQALADPAVVLHCLMSAFDNERYHYFQSPFSSHFALPENHALHGLQMLQAEEHLRVLVGHDARVYSSFVYNSLSQPGSDLPFAYLARDEGLFRSALRAIFRSHRDRELSRDPQIDPRLFRLSDEFFAYRICKDGVCTNAFGSWPALLKNLIQEPESVYWRDVDNSFLLRFQLFVQQAHPLLRQTFASRLTEEMQADALVRHKEAEARRAKRWRIKSLWMGQASP